MSSKIIRNSKFTILNEYRHSKSTGRTMGKDSSSNYSFDKNINLYIYHKRFNSLITFKCFLESFEIGFDIKYDTLQSTEGEIMGNPNNFSINYNLKMQVPSLSVNDARVNDARFSELNRMMIGQYTTDPAGKRRTYIDQAKRVLLGNLIHNGLYRREISITSKNQVEKYGQRCRFSSVSWNPDVDMGFFEYKGKLWPKSYSFDLDLRINLNLDKKLGTNKRSFSGFEPDGDYHASDIRTWPFGV